MILFTFLAGDMEVQCLGWSDHDGQIWEKTSHLLAKSSKGQKEFPEQQELRTFTQVQAQFPKACLNFSNLNLPDH